MPSYKVSMYSFKGGAGRTVTMANVAYVLAREMGRRVLCIDLDIESAGASVIFDLRSRVKSEDIWTLQDVLKGRFESAQKEGGPPPQSIQLGRDDFATTLWPKLHARIWPSGDVIGIGGQLDVLPARTVLSSTDEVKAGSYDASQQFSRLLQKLDLLVVPSPEFVLYDSAAGQQDTAALGILNSHMLVIFVRWSRQFVFGTIDFLSEYIEREQTRRLDKILLVPTAVPDTPPEEDIAEKLEERMGQLRSMVSFINEQTPSRDLIEILDPPIPECSGLKWDDQVFLSLERPPEHDDVRRTMEAYRAIARKIIQQAGPRNIA